MTGAGTEREQLEAAVATAEAELANAEAQARGVESIVGPRPTAWKDLDVWLQRRNKIYDRPLHARVALIEAQLAIAAFEHKQATTERSRLSHELGRVEARVNNLQERHASLSVEKRRAEAELARAASPGAA